MLRLRSTLGQIITPIGDDSQCIAQIQEHIQFGRGFFPGVASFNITGTWNNPTLATLDNLYGSRNAWRKIGNACQIKTALLSGYAPNVSQGERGRTAQPASDPKGDIPPSTTPAPSLVAGLKPEHIGIGLVAGAIAIYMLDKRSA